MFLESGDKLRMRQRVWNDHSTSESESYQENCLISIYLPRFHSRKGRILFLSLFRLLIPMPGENHMPMISLKNMFFVFFPFACHSSSKSLKAH